MRKLRIVTRLLVALMIVTQASVLVAAESPNASTDAQTDTRRGVPGCPSAQLPGSPPGSYFGTADSSGPNGKNRCDPGTNTTDPMNIMVYGKYRGYVDVYHRFQDAQQGWQSTPVNDVYAKRSEQVGKQECVDSFQHCGANIGDFNCPQIGCRIHFRIWAGCDYCSSTPNEPTILAVSYEHCVSYVLGFTPQCDKHEVTDFNNARTRASNDFVQGIKNFNRSNPKNPIHYTEKVKQLYRPGTVCTEQQANGKCAPGHVVAYDGKVTVFTVT